MRVQYSELRHKFLFSINRSINSMRLDVCPSQQKIGVDAKSKIMWLQIQAPGC